MTTATAIQNRAETQIARPLKVLAPLIAEDIKRGEKAGLPHYEAAGAKIIEARDAWTGSAPEFWAEAEKRVGRSHVQLKRYMAAARAAKDDGLDRRRSNTPKPTTLSQVLGDNRANHEPKWVRESVGSVDPKPFNQPTAAPVDERTLRNELALQLIDIGYKALATKLHPDKGGSREAMTRLNQVRQMLKGLVR
jgi:hypothetical protein